MGDETRTLRVDLLTRVEGEGRFVLHVEDGRAVAAQLEIFEAPRYFEAFLRGRTLDEVPDIVARICGICPIAYQMSAVRALEEALGVTPTAEIRALRRLLYCGEWIQSHALHVFLLHAPDFLGYHSAFEMGEEHGALVERGLRIKAAGNALIELLGGRSIHPVSVRVGGFTRAPTARALRALRPELEAALAACEETVRWAAARTFPGFEHDAVFVALESDDYPMEWGDGVRISGRGVVPVEEFEEVFPEQQVPHSNALQCRLADGTPYACGPLARLNLAHERLHPRARAALDATGLVLPIRNPHRALIARAVELVHAFAEALDIIDAYAAPLPPYLDAPPRDGEGRGATEAPRGLLYHRYRTGADGLVQHATIVPPTSQNQARIEADLLAMGPRLLAQDHDAATAECERLIRAYDPCISCATHALRFEVAERPGRGGGAAPC